ncbi:hypothetical protein FF124_18090 [Martelella lutilitoris]|uniref:Uncharacterized protein n=1 Tax=Martelella lutilitoris TaxID=2583532 RepID=A0A5C4JMS0_9HYPH|nr:hypothetical protein [Martelella lutilitoris]TNB46434.1 hypothetical protein FF124_18090 [Martelella lutilitoris]
MSQSFAPSAALLRSTLVARPWHGDAELARAYETGLAHTQKADTKPRQTIANKYSRFIQYARKKVISPDRAASRARKRSWAGASRLPKELRSEFTEGERAALSVVAEEVLKHGRCDLPLDKIAALAGVSRTTCQNAFRKAKGGPSPCIAVEERPQRGRKSLTNIIRIVSQEWKRWLKNLIGFKRLNPTKNKDNKPTQTARAEGPRRAFEGERRQSRSEAETPPTGQRRAEGRDLADNGANHGEPPAKSPGRGVV